MFSKKTMVIVGIIFLIAVNITVITIFSRHRYASPHPGKISLLLVSPFQDAVTTTLRFVRDVWSQYFYLVSAAKENDDLKRRLSLEIQKNKHSAEVELSNERLRKLLNFQRTVTDRVLAAEVIGKDPSPWSQTVIIDKGGRDGVVKGLPVVLPEGIAGQVIEVSTRHSKVLLIIDPNSAVDALVQRTRSRGLIKGSSGGRCLFQYVLRKHDIRVGDIVVSSGLDGVYPKGIQIGKVTGVVRRNAGIFQEVAVIPNVDFEKLEEVLIILNPNRYGFEND